MEGYESDKEKREVPLQRLFQIVNIIDENGITTCYAIVKIDGEELTAFGARKRNLKDSFPLPPENYLQVSVLSMQRVLEILKAVTRINPETVFIDFNKFSAGDSIMLPQEIYELLSYGFNPTIYIDKEKNHFYVPNTNPHLEITSIITACEIICTAIRCNMLPIVLPKRNERYVFDPVNKQYIVYSLSGNKVLRFLHFPGTLLPINNPIYDRTVNLN